MIAQKIVDAKHSQKPGHAPIAKAHLTASAPRTFSLEHLFPLLLVSIFNSRDRSVALIRVGADY